MRAAISSGYRKGFNTIVDANVVTIITAFVLFAVATGGVKGFALMLIIGTLISMVTAVAVTRALLGVLAGFRWFNNPAFMGASAQKIPAWQRVDFIGRTKYWFAVSGAVLLIGIASLAIQGLNLGIDFKGGSQFSFKTPQAHQIQDVREQTTKLGVGDAVIQGRGQIENGAYKEFQVRTPSLGLQEQTDLSAALTSNLDATSVGVKNVSASFSQQILKGAILAIFVSLALIVIYVTLRFEFKFAVPVLIALVHDILITLGIYSLTQREVTSATVAAILTILGYSIYDTIIIFDRVRENIPLMRRSSFAAIANQSLWETIRRSLATTFITLLPVTSLFLFGGDTLKDFAFALMVGILSGAYSTIFIATPFLVVLKEREPEFAKRKSAGLREKVEDFDVPEEAEPGIRSGRGGARRGTSSRWTGPPRPTRASRRARPRGARPDASDAARNPMDEPGSGDHDSKSLRGLAEEALLAGIGAIALTRDRADELVQELVGRGKMTGDDARELVDDVMGRWRGDAVRMSERAGTTLSVLFRELGLITRREYEELELRLAQVEHRLRLVEKKDQ